MTVTRITHDILEHKNNLLYPKGTRITTGVFAWNVPLKECINRTWDEWAKQYGEFNTEDISILIRFSTLDVIVEVSDRMKEE